LKNKKLNEILLLCLGVVTVLVSIYIWIRVPYKVLWEFHFGVAPVILIVFFNRFVFRQGGFLRKNVCKFFFFLGKHSMNMYIFHTLLREQILKEFLYSMKYPILTILSLLFISLAISVVFDFVKKLIKYDKLIGLLENRVLSLFSSKA
jgi:surface polysaccharide O-acyltransferase-like enzyme